MVSLCMMLWGLWNVHNNEVIKGYLTPPHIAFSFARSLHEEFLLHNFLHRPILPRQPREEQWCTPSIGTIKVTMDALRIRTRRQGVGRVLPLKWKAL